MISSRTTTRLAWTTLVANLFVIVWGGWVRASGSGAGCGNHWPTCNGVIIPASPTMHTIIEFTHRLGSGIALLLIVALVLVTRRVFARGHAARAAAVASLVLICIEALIGAGLVKFELVAANASVARAFTLGIHLVNTQFLLSAILLTAWWSSGHRPPDRTRLRALAPRFLIGFAGLIAVGFAGAFASLGDTLYPVRSLAEGMAQDRSPAASVMLHVRVWHPVLAIVVGGGLVWLAALAPSSAARAARGVAGTVLLQWTIGVLSLVLLVPVALQLAHLLTSDLVWLSLVWLLAASTEG